MCRPDLRRVGATRLMTVTQPLRPARHAPTMPKSEQPSRRHDADAEYSYRRPLRVREMLPAIGIGVAVGVFAFYVTRVLLQRTPIEVDRRPGVRRAAGRREQTADA